MRTCFFVQPQYVLFAALAALPAMAAASAPCEVGTFQVLGLPQTSILLVESLGAGSHPSPVGTIEAPICRVRARFDPANFFEVWLPTSTWNRKYQGAGNGRSEEHTSELQSPSVISYAVFCLDRKSVV